MVVWPCKVTVGSLPRPGRRGHEKKLVGGGYGHLRHLCDNGLAAGQGQSARDRARRWQCSTRLKRPVGGPLMPTFQVAHSLALAICEQNQGNLGAVVRRDLSADCTGRL